MTRREMYRPICVSPKDYRLPMSRLDLLLEDLKRAEKTVAGLRWSVAVRSSSASTDRSFAYDTDCHHVDGAALKTASVGKIFLLLYVAKMLERKEASGTPQGDIVVPPASLGDLLPVIPGEGGIVADSGLWHLVCTSVRGDLSGYSPLLLRDACMLVGAVSDNAATNLLLHFVGNAVIECNLSDHICEGVGSRTRAAVEAIAQLTQSIFSSLHDDHSTECSSFLFDQVRDERLPEKHPETISRGRSTELASLLLEAHRQAVGGDISSTNRRFLGHLPGWLQNNTDLSMVASAFFLDPLAHQSYAYDSTIFGTKALPSGGTPLPENGVVHFFNKTGTDEGVRADTGVIVLESMREGDADETVAYSVICNWDSRDATPSNRIRDRAMIMRCMRGVGEYIFDKCTLTGVGV